MKPEDVQQEQSASAVQRNEYTSGTESLMEQVVANMLAALGCRTARPVVWEDGGGDAPAYPIPDAR